MFCLPYKRVLSPNSIYPSSKDVSTGLWAIRPLLNPFSITIFCLKFLKPSIVSLPTLCTISAPSVCKSILFSKDALTLCSSSLVTNSISFAN
jgi:hypothetical protein